MKFRPQAHTRIQGDKYGTGHRQPTDNDETGDGEPQRLTVAQPGAERPVVELVERMRRHPQADAKATSVPMRIAPVDHRGQGGADGHVTEVPGGVRDVQKRDQIGCSPARWAYHAGVRLVMGPARSSAGPHEQAATERWPLHRRSQPAWRRTSVRPLGGHSSAKRSMLGREAPTSLQPPPMRLPATGNPARVYSHHAGNPGRPAELDHPYPAAWSEPRANSSIAAGTSATYLSR